MTEAIVCGGVNYADADRIVYLLTRRGRVDAFAPGARKSRRRFAGCLEPFTTIEAEFSPSRRGRRGLPTLSSAQAVETRLGLRRALESITLASYLAELAIQTSVGGEPSDDVFALLASALDGLCVAPASRSARVAFELQLASALGYQPELARCVVCQEEPARLYLDLVQGGLLCVAHRGTAPEIGPRTLQWARAAIEQAGGGPPAEFDDRWAETAATRLVGATAVFFGNLLVRPPKALTLLETL